MRLGEVTYLDCYGFWGMEMSHGIGKMTLGSAVHNYHVPSLTAQRRESPRLRQPFMISLS